MLPAGIELLLACAGTNVSAQKSDRIKVLARETTEWQPVLLSAAEHGIRPLLYRNLNTICPDVVPQPMLDHLRGFMFRNAAYNLVMVRELVRLLEGFKDQGISAIPFKGPAVGSWAYNDPALRESGDLDIVIRRKSLGAAKEFLATQSYYSRPPRNNQGVADSIPEDERRYHVFVGRQSQITLDLQVSLEAPHFSFRLDDERLWQCVTARKLTEKTVSTFSMEHLLILLCVHGTKDLWFRIKWVCDIAEFVQRNSEINWEYMLSEAARIHARRKLLLGCFLAHKLLAAALPEQVLLQASKDSAIQACAELVVRKLCASDRRYTDRERTSLYFKTEDTLRDKTRRYLHYVPRFMQIALVPNDEDRRSIRLPRFLSAGYYLVRPVRMISKYGTKPRLAGKALRQWFAHWD